MCAKANVKVLIEVMLEIEENQIFIYLFIGRESKKCVTIRKTA